MGRKMGVRGRPGLFFVTILIIFLAIFFLTWKSMMTPKRKAEVKDVYAMNFQSVNENRRVESKPPSDFNDVWHRAKLLNGGKIDEQDNERDEDYNFKNSEKLNAVLPNLKKEDIKSPLAALLHESPQPPVVKQVIKEPYYMKPVETLKIIGGRMERFVHLDLKGAAPKLSYFKEIFPLFSRLGATGLLIEYEDMFPYSGKLQAASAENAYTKEQIKELLGIAKLNSLQVIPLVQTFGHMEFILKASHLKGIRESEYTPQVIDITSNASYEVIQDMIGQVMEAHPEATYLHIGCDEVYELGKGKSSDVIVKERISTDKLFLRHVRRVAGMVAERSQEKVKPIMWDDELRKMPDEDILAAGLPSAVDIMIWRYTQNITDVLNEEIWMKYGRLFKKVWAASSFKGATGPRQIYTEPQHHIINHFSWMDAVAKFGRYVSFKGIALTGWQRFDHFATLCELLPVAIPSLAVSLATIKNGGFDEDIHKTTSKLLSCSGMIEMSFPQLDKKGRKAIVTQDCRFPGHMVYYAVQQLWGYKQFSEEDRKSGWLSDYQISHGFSNPGQLKVLSMRLFALDSDLLQIRQPLENELLQIYSPDTVEEWLDENIFEMQRQNKAIQSKIKAMSQTVHWARRPNLPFVQQHAGVSNDAGVGVKVGSVNTDAATPNNQNNQLDIHGGSASIQYTNDNKIFNPNVIQKGYLGEASQYVPSRPNPVQIETRNTLLNNNHRQPPPGENLEPRVNKPVSLERKKLIRDRNDVQLQGRDISYSQLQGQNTQRTESLRTNDYMKETSKLLNSKANVLQNQLHDNIGEADKTKNMDGTKQVQDLNVKLPNDILGDMNGRVDNLNKNHFNQQGLNAQEPALVGSKVHMPVVPNRFLGNIQTNEAGNSNNLNLWENKRNDKLNKGAMQQLPDGKAKLASFEKPLLENGGIFNRKHSDIFNRFGDSKQKGIFGESNNIGFDRNDILKGGKDLNGQEGTFNKPDDNDLQEGNEKPHTNDKGLGNDKEDGTGVREVNMVNDVNKQNRLFESLQRLESNPQNQMGHAQMKADFKKGEDAYDIQ